MILIDGKKVAGELKQGIKAEVLARLSRGLKRPHLAAVLVGTDGGSETYVANKVRDCEEVGFQSTLIRLDEKAGENELLDVVRSLNKDVSVDGFIVQLPLPSQIREQVILEAIDPEKDVDGFHPVNIGKMTL